MLPALELLPFQQQQAILIAQLTSKYAAKRLSQQAEMLRRAVELDIRIEAAISPEHIVKTCEEIQATWSESTRRERARGYTIDSMGWHRKELTDLRCTCADDTRPRPVLPVPTNRYRDGQWDNIIRAYEDMYE